MEELAPYGAGEGSVTCVPVLGWLYTSTPTGVSTDSPSSGGCQAASGFGGGEGMACAVAGMTVEQSTASSAASSKMTDSFIYTCKLLSYIFFLYLIYAEGLYDA